jgi:hypothetical protein
MAKKITIRQPAETTPMIPTATPATRGMARRIVVCTEEKRGGYVNDDGNRHAQARDASLARVPAKLGGQLAGLRRRRLCVLVRVFVVAIRGSNRGSRCLLQPLLGAITLIRRSVGALSHMDCRCG